MNVKPCTDEAICPKCGGLMEGGVCSKCGYTGSEAPCVEGDGCKPKGKKADGTSVQRLDYWGPLNEIARKTEPMTLQPDGTLKGKAAVTCVGVFRYAMPDGSVRHEFRPPEEVFKEESLDTLELRPLTNTHPAQGVTPANFQEVTVGTLGEEIENDAYNVYAEIRISEAEAIAAAQNGRTGLSCGYSADMVESGTVEYPVMGEEYDELSGTWKQVVKGTVKYAVPGVWGGIPYDAIQTNIVYNHVALVGVPRGGDALHLRFDGADHPIGVLVPRVDGNPAGGSSVQERNNMKKIRLDGAVEHDVPEAVAAHIEGLQAKVDGFAAEKAEGAASLAAANAALEAVRKDHDDLKASIPAQVQEAVSARLALVQKADSLGVTVKAEDSEDAIHGAVIAAAMPDVKVDGLSEPERKAYFAAACSVLAGRQDSGVHQRQQVADGLPSTEDKADGSDWGSFQAEARSKR